MTGVARREFLKKENGGAHSKKQTRGRGREEKSKLVCARENEHNSFGACKKKGAS